jgi:hypothetical protein
MVNRRWYEASLIDVEKKEKKGLLVERSKHESTTGNCTRLQRCAHYGSIVA